MNLILKQAMKSKEWHRAALDYAFKFQSISKDKIFSKMKPVFIDSNGMRYFEFIDLDDMPIPRFDEMQITLQELGNRISNSDLDQFVDVCQSIINQEKGKNKISDISAMLSALKSRRQVLYDPYLMFKMCACLYIREDQDPSVWDEDLEKNKIEQFKKDSREGLYDFFYKAGLANYLPKGMDGSIPLKSELMQRQEAENMEYQIKEFQELLATLQKS